MKGWAQVGAKEGRKDCKNFPLAQTSRKFFSAWVHSFENPNVPGNSVIAGSFIALLTTIIVAFFHLYNTFFISCFLFENHTPGS